jgi:hypothetical protein
VLAIEQLRLRRPEEPWLIPVRFDECDIPDRDIGGGRTLNSLQRADLFGADADDSAARLLHTAHRILGPADPAGDSPESPEQGKSPRADGRRRRRLAGRWPLAAWAGLAVMIAGG